MIGNLMSEKKPVMSGTVSRSAFRKTTVTVAGGGSGSPALR